MVGYQPDQDGDRCHSEDTLRFPCALPQKNLLNHSILASQTIGSKISVTSANEMYSENHWDMIAALVAQNPVAILAQAMLAQATFETHVAVARVQGFVCWLVCVCVPRVFLVTPHFFDNCSFHHRWPLDGGQRTVDETAAVGIPTAVDGTMNGPMIEEMESRVHKLGSGLAPSVALDSFTWNTSQHSKVDWGHEARSSRVSRASSTRSPERRRSRRNKVCRARQNKEKTL